MRVKAKSLAISTCYLLLFPSVEHRTSQIALSYHITHCASTHITHSSLCKIAASVAARKNVRFFVLLGLFLCPYLLSTVEQRENCTDEHVCNLFRLQLSFLIRPKFKVTFLLAAAAAAVQCSSNRESVHNGDAITVFFLVLFEKWSKYYPPTHNAKRVTRLHSWWTLPVGFD